MSRSDNVLVLWFRYRLNEGKEELKVKKVYFFWICRDTFAFEWFTDLLKHLEVQVIPFLQRMLFYIMSLTLKQALHTINLARSCLLLFTFYLCSHVTYRLFSKHGKSFVSNAISSSKT